MKLRKGIMWRIEINLPIFGIHSQVILI